MLYDVIYNASYKRLVAQLLMTSLPDVKCRPNDWRWIWIHDLQTP